MQRPTILILPFHGIGHFNALFGVAKALQETHHVIFAGHRHFYQHVHSKGFEYLTLWSYPFGIGLETWIHETKKSKYPKLRSIIDRWKDALYNERKTELTNILQDIKPVHVLLDVQQATDLIVLKKIDADLRISLISVAPPYLLLPGLPPINTLAMPNEGEEAYKKGIENLRKKRWRYWRKCWGMNDWTIINRRLRRNEMMHLKGDHPSLIQFAAKGVDQYVLTYKAYDFYHPYLDHFKYVGPHSDVEYSEEWLRRLDTIRSTGKRIVYCAFGTVPSKKNIDAFMENVNKAIADLNCELIFGSKTNWVPQSTVLSRADVFITHGGINSIHDAIRFKVPMIVYPIDSNYDQNGNSSRVIYHGFGLRGDFDSATTDNIREKLVEIFTDIRFKKNLEAFDTSHYDIKSFIKLLV